MLSMKPITEKITIEIHEEADTVEDMAECLRHIAKLLEEGYVEGYYPTWGIKKVENKEIK